MNPTRLSHHPAEVIDRTKNVTFSFTGKVISAHPGDTVGAALYAAGVRIFSRSFKYHRPRGVLCFSGKCPNCLMTVDGTPNVRSCLEPVRQGMQVKPQNVWPTLELDAFAIIDKLHRLLPIGFYYKTFIKPRFVWPLVVPVLRRLAGLGIVDERTGPSSDYDHQYRHTDVAVVGGGPAGLMAAREAARLGAQVTLVDDGTIPGGHLRFQSRTYGDVGEYSGLCGLDIARRLSDEVRSLPDVTVLDQATAFGGYEGGLLGITRGNRLIHLRTKRLVVATGSDEYPSLFHNNDLPGIMLGSGIQRLLHLYRVKPGQRALVVTNNESGLTLACDLLDAGIQVAAVADARSSAPTDSERSQRLKAAGIPLLSPYVIQAAQGDKRVERATLIGLDTEGRPAADAKRSFSCDLICLSTDRAPAGALLSQSGGHMAYDAELGEIVARQLPSHVYAAGDVSGVHDLRATLLEGQAAGIAAAMSLGFEDTEEERDRCSRQRREASEIGRAYRQQYESYPCLSHPRDGKKKFVCLCEDVTEKDLIQGVGEGFDEIETLKRYSTVSMGVCQGRMCALTSIGICARETGMAIDETGTTTPRPPIQPVALGVLAGRNHYPVKRTPLHHKHLGLGAEMMNLGAWKRPYAYSSPAEECRAVRERVGLIDVSTLGKLDVKGKDAARLLDKVYTHTFSSLRVGRVRYGVMCDDSGVILDDGTVSRLAEDHFFITTTTGNVEFVEQWFKWWAIGMCVHVTNLTGGFAAMNLAGPKARAVLSQLTELDLRSRALPYMACARGKVAAVPALFLRIGFVGETGWEMHVPAESSGQVWDALMAAGKGYGIAPFGLEAQRTLRLEKKHLIVGQDTDALSNPLEADMAWAVKFNKGDFIGKNALLSVQERGVRQKLVGFVMRDRTMVDGGNAVAVDGKPVGRVASARLSPAVGKCIGLAWVPTELSEHGKVFEIHVNGGPATADIVDAAFYDPEGARVRS